ncbi:MAG: hypothetical protein JRC86_00835 [Deltaproteobacteria bacterium]|nr:hypothetical protein [Deltaproteobacteria bacterium]
MSSDVQKKFEEQRKQRRVARTRRAQWALDHPAPKPISRWKRNLGLIADMVIMPFFYIADGWVNTLRKILNVS